jgi:hypothetical protein
VRTLAALRTHLVLDNLLAVGQHLELFFLPRLHGLPDARVEVAPPLAAARNDGFAAVAKPVDVGWVDKQPGRCTDSNKNTKMKTSTIEAKRERLASAIKVDGVGRK